LVHMVSKSNAIQVGEGQKVPLPEPQDHI